MSAQGGVYWGCLPRGRLLKGGCLLAWEGVHLRLWIYENITFQQLLLRTVIRNNTEEIIDILSLLCYVDVNHNGEYLLTITTGNCIT